MARSPLVVAVAVVYVCAAACGTAVARADNGGWGGQHRARRYKNLGIQLPAGYVATRFGAFHESCVLEVPTGSTVAEVPTDNAKLAGVKGTAIDVTFPNGTRVTRPGCMHRPVLTQRTARGLQTGKPSGANDVNWFDVEGEGQYAYSPETVDQWNGMYYHSWFGLDRAPFLDPLPADIVNISGAWVVPSIPSSKPAPGAPWSNRPTLSLWPGVQGGYVLQPVMELNGLLTDYDAVSWNCCPSGAVVHATPCSTNPGDSLWGKVARQGTSQVFEIRTTVENSQCSSVLRADMSSLSWTANWAEFVAEAYYVSQCNEFMDPMYFTDTELVLENGQTLTGCGMGLKTFFEAASVTSPTTPCSGKAWCASDELHIAYDTSG